jgi:hypothetical protein
MNVYLTRFLGGHDRLRELQLTEGKKKIQTGLDQLDRGEGIPGDEVHVAMKRKSAAIRKTKR